MKSPGTWIVKSLRCPTHHGALVTYCPACRGTQGGKSTSSAKAAAARRNASKARKVRAAP